MISPLITQSALTTLEKGLNKLLAMDSKAIEQLATLEGKVLTIQSTTPAFCFSIIPTTDYVFLTQQTNVAADAKLTAPVPLLMQLLLAQDKQLFLKNSSIMIVGESTVLYRFFEIIDRLNPDWEHELSQWFGPTTIGLITQSIKLGNEQLKQGVSFMHSQLTNLFNNDTTNSNNDEKPQNPMAGFLDSLQKSFGKS